MTREAWDRLARELLCQPREAGTPGAEQARDRVAQVLEAAGYRVRVQRFRFSTSALLALPLLGAGIGWLALLLIPLLVIQQVSSWIPLALWLAGAAALGLLALGLGLGWGTLGAPRECANLVATRGDAAGTWLVAHLDTKAQGHSMAGRLVAVWTLVVAALVMTGLAVARLFAPVSLPAVSAGAALSVVAGFLCGRGRLRGASPGARDNGSGLLAVLRAAQLVRDSGVGILITSAEEFGLIGARYFVQEQGGTLAGVRMVNVDTVDDRGPWRLVAHDRNGETLVRDLQTALGSEAVRRHRLPAGVFVDSLPLARAGAEAATLARLDWATFRRIHTPRDTLEGLGLDSAWEAGAALARWVAP